MSYQYYKVIEYLLKDLSLKEPKISNSIFDINELLSLCNIELNEDNKKIYEDALSKMHIITRTNKISPNGQYYNISRRIYRRFRKKKDDKKWLGLDKPLNNGFCIINTPAKIFRLDCRSYDCKFFLSSENMCVKNKIFLNNDY